jgi:hypothetical protein
MRVRATRMGWDGFALKRRRVGDVFDFPDSKIGKDKNGKPKIPTWMEPVGVSKPANAGKRPEAPAETVPDVPEEKNSDDVI